MDQFDGHPGTAKLAQVLDKRTSQKTESPLTLDFGEIQANGSLKTNTFPVPIPKGDYTICRLAAGLTLSTSEQSWLNKAPSGVPLHSHSVTIPAVKAGDRVLVAWIQSEAVVIDVIEKGKCHSHYFRLLRYRILSQRTASTILSTKGV